MGEIGQKHFRCGAPEIEEGKEKMRHLIQSGKVKKVLENMISS